MQQIFHYISFLLIWDKTIYETIKCLAFLSLLECQVFLLQTKDDATTIKPRENGLMFDYKSQRLNTAEFCQTVSMVSVVFFLQNLVTTIDYKCQYYLNKSNLMDICSEKSGFLQSVLMFCV